MQYRNDLQCGSELVAFVMLQQNTLLKTLCYSYPGYLLKSIEKPSFPCALRRAGKRLLLLWLCRGGRAESSSRLSDCFPFPLAALASGAAKLVMNWGRGGSLNPGVFACQAPPFRPPRSPGAGPPDCISQRPPRRAGAVRRGGAGGGGG